jgi:hypothetical protein
MLVGQPAAQERTVCVTSCEARPKTRGGRIQGRG